MNRVISPTAPRDLQFEADGDERRDSVNTGDFEVGKHVRPGV
jgi:hypothetical protein